MSCTGETKHAKLWVIWQDDGDGERQRYQDDRDGGGGWICGGDLVEQGTVKGGIDSRMM